MNYKKIKERRLKATIELDGADEDYFKASQELERVFKIYR